MRARTVGNGRCESLRESQEEHLRAKDYRRINSGKKPRFCRYCSVLLTKSGPTKATKDHVVPRSKGGSNARYNIVMACYACNQAKDDSIPFTASEHQRKRYK